MKFLNYINETSPAEQAAQLGLEHIGWGKYADKKGNVVAIIQDGVLKRLPSKEETEEKKVEAKDQRELEQARKEVDPSLPFEETKTAQMISKQFTKDNIEELAEGDEDVWNEFLTQDVFEELPRQIEIEFKNENVKDFVRNNLMQLKQFAGEVR